MNPALLELMRTVGRLALGAPAGLVLGWGLIAVQEQAGAMLSLRWLLLLPVWFFLATAVHEVAHLAAGKAVGVRFPQWQIGPLTVQQEYRPPRISWRWESTFHGGHVSARPVRHDHLALRMALLVAAGPAASLLLACGLYLAVSRAAWHGSLTQAEILIAFWMVAATLFWVSLVPMRRAGVMSDGSLLWLLRNPGEERERWLAQLRMLSGLDQGIRPAIWTDEDVAALLAGEREAGLEGSLYLAYLAAMDRGDLAAAGIRLDRWLAALDEAASARRFALQEAAWFHLMRRNDEARARDMAVQLARTSSASPSHLRGEAAVAILRGNRDEIDAALRRYEEEISALSHHPLAPVDRACLAELRERAALAQAGGGSGTIEAQ